MGYAWMMLNGWWWQMDDCNGLDMVICRVTSYSVKKAKADHLTHRSPQETSLMLPKLLACFTAIEDQTSLWTDDLKYTYIIEKNPDKATAE